MNNDHPIFRSLTVIEERIQEKLTVESLADSIHFSKYHYQRMFRELVGDSVMRYVARRRMALAAEELAQKETSVLEVALKYGYDSHEGFIRGFRAYMGVTPTEYRRYHLSIASPIMQKERCAMLYSKVTDEMLRELNGLIVRARETAAYTRKRGETISADLPAYTRLWEFIADRTDAMAVQLAQTLERITLIAQQPDAISARFILIKAIEDAVFWSDITAFQAKLTVSRAKPEHRALFEPICAQYEQLAQEAHVKSGKLAAFFRELSMLIFRDMRENAQTRIQQTIESGRAAAAKMSAEEGGAYAYSAGELTAIVDSLCATPLEAVSVGTLEDTVLRLDIITFAADVDALRVPPAGDAFEEIAKFREQLCETMAFFQTLSGDLAQALAQPQEGAGVERTADKACEDMAFQGNILLFYLKGELQKLGGCLSEEQKADLDAVCGRMEETVKYAQHASDRNEIKKKLRAVYEDILAQAQKLDEYGEPLRCIAKEIERMVAV